jgi:meso-butanediol dehydrogenase/(S,S)-butanediol dehydrogenase/diacetyl reductase
MNRRFEGKVAVVTGAGRRGGLGEAIARKLAVEGCSIILSDIGKSADATTPESMIGTLPEMQSLAMDMAKTSRSRVVSFACDVRNHEQMRRLAAHAEQTFGALDIWVNNAGIGYIMKPLAEVTPEDWQAVIDVNLTGCFYGIKVASERMIARGRGGRIINIASQAAKSGFPFAAAYCASKHGMVGLVRSAAIELGKHNITVNNVCPNHVTTALGAWQNEYFSQKLGLTLEQYLAQMKNRIPLGRPGLPEDTANAVAFLCSEEAAYVTAESMNVSGGEEPH